MTVDFTDVVHAADVWMRHLSCGAHFVVKLRQTNWIAADGVWQKLEGDGLTEAQIVRAIDLTHAAAADESDHAIAAIQDHARREAPVTNGIRRGEPSAR